VGQIRVANHDSAVRTIGPEMALPGDIVRVDEDVVESLREDPEFSRLLHEGVFEILGGRGRTSRDDLSLQVDTHNFALDEARKREGARRRADYLGGGSTLISDQYVSMMAVEGLSSGQAIKKLAAFYDMSTSEVKRRLVSTGDEDEDEEE